MAIALSKRILLMQEFFEALGESSTLNAVHAAIVSALLAAVDVCFSMQSCSAGTS